MSKPKKAPFTTAQAASFMLRQGFLNRSEAAVFAIIAFWEYAAGGVTIDGEIWRWRSTQHLAAETNYSTRQITKALAFLRAIGLIHSRVIWHPIGGYGRVNAFRVSSEGQKFVRTIVKSIEDPENLDKFGQIVEKPFIATPSQKS